MIKIAKSQKPSDRGELEITDVNRTYLLKNRLKVEKWEGLYLVRYRYSGFPSEASQFVQTLEKRQGMKISCIEEIAFRMGYINKIELESLGNKMVNNPYSIYLKLRIKNSVSSSYEHHFSLFR